MVSPWPSCISPPDSTSVSPPICRTPTSKLTRVRVEGFSKISATIRPASGRSASGAPCGGPARAAFIARRRARIARSSSAGVVQVEEVPHAAAASTAAAARSSRRSPSSASASVRFRGGRIRDDVLAPRHHETRAS